MSEILGYLLKGLLEAFYGSKYGWIGIVPFILFCAAIAYVGFRNDEILWGLIFTVLASVLSFWAWTRIGKGE